MITPYIFKVIVIFMRWFWISTQYQLLPNFEYKNRYQEF